MDLDSTLRSASEINFNTTEKTRLNYERWQTNAHNLHDEGIAALTLPRGTVSKIEFVLRKAGEDPIHLSAEKLGIIDNEVVGPTIIVKKWNVGKTTHALGVQFNHVRDFQVRNLSLITSRINEYGIPPEPTIMIFENIEAERWNARAIPFHYRLLSTLLLPNMLSGVSRLPHRQPGFRQPQVWTDGDSLLHEKLMELQCPQLVGKELDTALQAVLKTIDMAIVSIQQ